MNINLWEDLGSYILPDSIRLFIPSSYVRIITGLMEESLDPEQKEQLSQVILLLQEIGRSETGIEYMEYQSAALVRTTSMQANLAILEGLQELERSFPDAEIRFFSQNRSLLREVSQLGYMTERIHIPFSKDYHDLFWDPYNPEFSEDPAVAVDIHPLGIDPGALWLITADEPGEDQRKRVLEEITARFPIEAMFRADNNPAGAPINYSLPIDMVRIIIRKADEDTREFINSVYETWIDDITGWYEEMVQRSSSSLRMNRLQVALKSNHHETLHDLRITCSLPERLIVLQDPVADGSPPELPKMPILTHRMCSDIDAIPPETYLRLFGEDLRDSTLLSPTWQGLMDESQDRDAGPQVVESQDHQVTFSASSLLPFDVLSMEIACSSGNDLQGDTPAAITCRIEAEELEIPITTTSTIPVVIKRRMILPFVRHQLNAALARMC